jgi:hypothetical protein
MTDHEPLPVVRLHPDEAEKRGVVGGEHVLIVSPVGSITATLHTDPGLRRDVLVSERGGWNKAGHGINKLCMDMASRVGRGTPYYETAVNVLPTADDGIRGKIIHLEVDAVIVNAWIQEFKNGEIESCKRYRDDYDDAFFETLLAELPVKIEQSEMYCRRITRNWLGFLARHEKRPESE